MFNLIVSSGPVISLQGSLPTGRILEYTSQSLEERFMPGGTLDVSSVLSLPALYMEEGLDDQIARVITLTRLERIGKDYHFRFVIDPAIPALTNSDIYEMRASLGIENFEFHRNHWAIKDADLFHALLTNKLEKFPRPSVFDLSVKPVNPRLVSIMMPFAGAFTNVYETIRTALNAEGFRCARADDFWKHAHIMQDIIELICTSRIVICDLSQKNPNVFYEAGIAHTLGKEVILITQSMDDVPFDLRALRCITYLNNNEGRDQLASEVVARIRTITGM